MSNREREEEFWADIEHRGVRAFARHGVWTLLLPVGSVMTEALLRGRDPIHLFAGVVTGLLFGGGFGLALFVGLLPAAILQFRAGRPGPRAAVTFGRTSLRYGVNALIVLAVLSAVMCELSAFFTDFSASIAQGPDSPPRVRPGHDVDPGAAIGVAWSVVRRLALPVTLGILIEWAGSNPGVIKREWAKRVRS